ncbi:MAG: PrsW family glutamic-type intramembrane protease [Ruminococcus sp.]|jgi:RsiW-degrading membrane proteinase PrsW (M82 family)|nr:PrsW family glutamic-type intramembrane protease [Ruminococcus sp.]
MEGMIYILYICMFVPLLLSLPLIQKASRSIMIFILIGISSALFISEVNGIMLRLLGYNSLYVTTTITPATEEIIKAIPILIYAFIITDNRDKLLTASFALGIGFALFENTYILVTSIDNVTIGWAIVRGFSTALMHGICTAAVGYGMSFVKKKKKLFYCGTISLLMLAVTYHGIFNMFVQSENLKNFGFLLPLATYIPVVIALVFRVRNKKKQTAK